MKAGKNKWIKPGAKIIVKGEEYVSGDVEGEILKIEGDQILVQITDSYWVSKHEIEPREAPKEAS